MAGTGIVSTSRNSFKLYVVLSMMPYTVYPVTCLILSFYIESIVVLSISVEHYFSTG